MYGVNPAEGRGRMLEGMDLILKAMTEPQPFSWEGQYYQYRTVSVWPRLVQQPFPAALVATRSNDAVRYAAEHHLGLGVSFIPVDDTGRITDKYHAWCDENGWQPQPDQMVFRGSIYLAETHALAQEWFDRQTDRGRAPGMALRYHERVLQQAQDERKSQTLQRAPNNKMGMREVTLRPRLSAIPAIRRSAPSCARRSAARPSH